MESAPASPKPGACGVGCGSKPLPDERVGEAGWGQGEGLQGACAPFREQGRGCLHLRSYLSTLSAGRSSAWRLRGAGAGPRAQKKKFGQRRGPWGGGSGRSRDGERGEGPRHRKAPLGLRRRGPRRVAAHVGGRGGSAAHLCGLTAGVSSYFSVAARGSSFAGRGGGATDSGTGIFF